jgi:hypothetical protein
MKLTGKCKEDFEKWYNSKEELYKYGFHLLPPSMQYGVYVDFFDSVDIELWIKPTAYTYYDFYISKKSEDLTILEGCGYETRTEARTEAIRQANKFYNQNK